MAIPKNQIANLKFLALLGQVQRPFQHNEIDQRPGVSGTGFTLVGTIGEPFTLRSQVDQVDLPSAQITVVTAIALTGVDIVSLIQDDYDFNTENIKVKILRVTVVKLQKLAAAASGGLNSPSRAWLELDWDLLCVKVDQQN